MLISELLAAFRADEPMERIAVLLIDDGFEAQVMRVLAAWMHADHQWKEPKAACPDAGRPTARAWDWLWSGYRADISAIATGAGVSREVAREKFELLRHNRLIYPDGDLSKVARAALRAHAARALSGGNGGGKRKRGAGAAPAGGGDQGVN